MVIPTVWRASRLGWLPPGLASARLESTCQCPGAQLMSPLLLWHPVQQRLQDQQPPLLLPLEVATSRLQQQQVPTQQQEVVVAVQRVLYPLC